MMPGWTRSPSGSGSGDGLNTAGYISGYRGSPVTAVDMTAMKAKNQTRLSALRMLKAAVMNKGVEKGHDLDDAEVLQVVASLVKQRRDSIDQFARAGRTDLVGLHDGALERDAARGRKSLERALTLKSDFVGADDARRTSQSAASTLPVRNHEPGGPAH